MMPSGALAGLLLPVWLLVCFLSPVAVGLSIVDGHGSARENQRKKRLGRMGLDGHVSADPGEDFDDAGLFGPYEGGPFDGEPDTHVYAFEGKQGLHRRYPNFPRSSHVAIVLRGAIMRNSHDKKQACLHGTIAGSHPDDPELADALVKKFGFDVWSDTHALTEQQKASESLVENVIAPLEQAGNTVDVILTDHDNCPFTYNVATWIGDSEEHPRVKVVSTQSVDDNRGEQRRNLLFALDALANYSGGKRRVAAEYNYVFILRHDTVWTKPMSEWPEADFSKVLFPYKCPLKGVHDLFTLMPASYFDSYYKIVYSGIECFQGADGHQCLRAMVRQEGEDSVSVAMHYDPKKTKFEPEVFWRTYGKPRQTC
jgi:hypothetical protein